MADKQLTSTLVSISDVDLSFNVLDAAAIAEKK